MYVKFLSVQLIVPFALHGPRGLGSQSSTSVWQNWSVHPGKHSHLKSLTRSIHIPFSHTTAVSQMLGVGVGVRIGRIAEDSEGGRESVGVGMIVNISSIGVLVATGISCVVMKLKTGVEVGKGSVSVERKTSVEVSGRKVDKMVSVVTGLGVNMLTDRESSDVGIGRRMDGDGVGEPVKIEELVESKMGDEKLKTKSDELGDGVRVGEGEGTEALGVGMGVLINSNTTEVVVGKKTSEDTAVVGKTVVWTIDVESTVVNGSTISVVGSGKMVVMEISGVGVRVLRVSEGDRGIRNSELSETLKITVV